MSGEEIDDHSSWLGEGSEDSVLPMGTKSQSMEGVMGGGGISNYPDTAEDIKRNQMANIAKMNSQAMPEGKRY